MWASSFSLEPSPREETAIADAHAVATPPFSRRSTGTDECFVGVNLSRPVEIEGLEAMGPCAIAEYAVYSVHCAYTERSSILSVIVRKSREDE
jgi:hypothetical protein